MGCGVWLALYARRRSNRLSTSQTTAQSIGKSLFALAVSCSAQRLYKRVQGIPADRYRRLPPFPLSAFQPHGGTALEDDRPRIFLDHHADHVAEPARR